jgi:hypothetical protein
MRERPLARLDASRPRRRTGRLRDGFPPDRPLAKELNGRDPTPVPARGRDARGRARPLSHGREALCLVEPGIDPPNHALARRDSCGEERLQESVAVNARRGGCRRPPTPPRSASGSARPGTCRARSPAPSGAIRGCRSASSPTALGGSRAADDAMRAATMGAECGRAAEAPATFGTDELTVLLPTASFAPCSCH